MTSKAHRRLLPVLAVTLLLLLIGRCPAGEAPWAFVALADPKPVGQTADGKGIQKSFGKDLMYLKDAFIDKAEPNRPAPSFVIVPGDFSPAGVTDQTFAKVLGEDFPWLPVMGNHDLSSRDAMAKVLARYEKRLGIHHGPKDGPPGQYEFTFRNVLFVAPDQHGPKTRPRKGPAKAAADEANSAGPPPIGAKYKWLQDTVAASKAPFRIVVVHEPAWPFHRHTGDLLHGTSEERDRFWQLLADSNCQLLLTGHTHAYSTYQWLGNADPDRWQKHTSGIIPGPLGVWQIDAGRAAGPASHQTRVLVYCKVTDECIEVETHVAAATSKGDRPWQVPPDARNARYRLKIYPEVKSNLPAGAPPVPKP